MGMVADRSHASERCEPPRTSVRCTQVNTFLVIAQVGMEPGSAQKLLVSLQKAGQHNTARDVLDFIARSGAAPDQAVFRVLVAFCETNGDWMKGMELVQVITSWHETSFVAFVACSALLIMLCPGSSNGRSDDAVRCGMVYNSIRPVSDGTLVAFSSHPPAVLDAVLEITCRTWSDAAWRQTLQP